MEVIVKNNQISKTHISKMAYNGVNNVLACNIDGNDTILFFSLHTESMTFIELFKGMSKPPGSKVSLNWSPDGRYLALGAGNIELWQLKQGKLKPVKSYQQDFIEIKIIQWSIDSLSYACGGISRTNTIRIRNIQTNKTKQLPLPNGQTISAISFDPYGKYLLLLLRNNTIDIYSVLNYEKYKTVRLSPQGLKINPIKEVRIPSWSPDFSNFVCPSLDDSRINVAINLSRSKDFKTKNIFMGHCTSISCCKFNPKLYRWEGQVTAIVAMGDSAGNVSFWRVGNKNEYPEPLLLSNSLQHSMQVVEDIQWDDKGQLLMVNMMKKYIHMIKFLNRQKCFGQQLTNDETFSLIKQTYGSNRATDVNKREIQVFNLNFSDWNGSIEQEEKKLDVNNEAQEDNKISQQPNNIIKQSIQQSQQNYSIQDVNNLIKPSTQMQVEEMIKIKPLSPLIQAKQNTVQLSSVQLSPFRPKPHIIAIPTNQSTNQYVKVCDQKITMGKNNRKKIQPAMMMRKDQISTIPINQQFSTSYNQGLPSNTTFFTNSMVQTFQSLELSPIAFTDKQITLNKHKILEIKRLNKVTSLEVIDLLEDNYEPIARRIFPMAVDNIYVTEKFIYVLNQKFLYVFDFELIPKELPLKVGQIHMFLANDFGDIFFINCQGYLIGFNHLQNVNKTIAPAPLHLLLRQDFRNESQQNSKLSIKQFLLTKTSDILITIETEKPNTKNKRQRFIYDVKKNGWVKLEFKEGILEPGFSIRITDSEQNMMKNFFTSLCPSLRQKSIKSDNLNQSKTRGMAGQSVISPQEEEIIFCSKYQNDKQKYHNSLIEYFRSLKMSNRNKQFRNYINKYFFDQKNSSFLNNKQDRQALWSRVKNQIGGNIIEEFQVGFLHQHMIQQE